MDVDALAPGRTLDALVAEKVMGEPKPTGNVPDGVLPWALTSSSDGGNWIGTTTGYTAGDEPVWLPKPYSTDISLAWEVVEKLCELESPSGDPYDIFVSREAPDLHWCCIVNSRVPHRDGGSNIVQQWEAFAKTAPLAICLAALKAVESGTEAGLRSKGHDQEREVADA